MKFVDSYHQLISNRAYLRTKKVKSLKIAAAERERECSCREMEEDSRWAMIVKPKGVRVQFFFFMLSLLKKITLVCAVVCAY